MKHNGRQARIKDMTKIAPIVRTRFAPSPTGLLHCGGIKTAIVCWLYAKKHGGEFLLRIEDTDGKRFDPAAEQYIIDTLNWLRITPDHGPTYGDGRYGPYRQSERNYKPYIDKLLSTGDAYYAFDTDEEMRVMRAKCDAAGKPFAYNVFTRAYMRNSLSMSSDDVNAMLANGESYVVRFKNPKDVDVRFTDIVRGTVAFNTSAIDDKVLWKSDGKVTYHLANVVDDHLMDITHVFRGEEWLSSTPLHLLLYDALEWKAPEFAHLPLIIGSNGKKISKRDPVSAGCPIFPFTVNVTTEDGETIVSEGFRNLGYLPDAVLNYLILLGWHPSDGKEIMTREELIEAFDIHSVNSAGAKMDLVKMTNFNREYISRLPAKDLVPFLPNNIFNYSDAQLEMIAKAALERASFAKDIASVVDYFFKDVEVPVNMMKKVDEFPKFLELVINKIDASAWEPELLYENIVGLIADLGIHRGSALNNLRLCITGGASGPKLHEMMAMMGRDEFLRRLNKAKNSLNVTAP